LSIVTHWRMVYQTCTRPPAHTHTEADVADTVAAAKEVFASL
jgi:hypothetical protein